MAKKRNGEGSLYKVETVSGVRWQASTTAGKDKKGNLIRVSGTGKTQAEALARRQKNLVKYLQRQNAMPDAYEAHRVSEVNLTVGRMLHKWLAQLNQETVNDTVRRGYQHRVELHLAPPPFGNIPLKALTPAQVRDHFQKTLVQKLKTKGSGAGVEPLLSYSSRKNIWVVLHMAMKWAMVEGYIEKLPGVVEARPRPSRQELSKKEVEQYQFADDDWKPKSVLMELAGREDEAQWLFQLVMACRQSEKLGLEWSNFSNLDGKTKHESPTVIIKQQLARNQVFHGCGNRNTETGEWLCGFPQANRCPKKTGDSGYYIYRSTKTVGGVRKVPIPKVLAQVLLEHKKRQDEWKLSREWKSPKGLEDLVFTTKTGQPIRHQQDTKDWRKLCDELGLGNLRGHTARHFAATTLIGSGFPIEVVGQILGHASEEITRKIYTKATQAALSPVVQDYEDELLKNRNDAFMKFQHEAYKNLNREEKALLEK